MSGCRREPRANWAFFGDQHRASDFIYADEFGQFVTDGVLTISTSHSHAIRNTRSRAEPDARRAPILLLARIRRPHSTCGDATRMAHDVDEALHELIAEHGGLSANDTEAPSASSNPTSATCATCTRDSPGGEQEGTGDDARFPDTTPDDSTGTAGDHEVTGITRHGCANASGCYCPGRARHTASDLDTLLATPGFAGAVLGPRSANWPPTCPCSTVVGVTAGPSSS